MTTCSFCDIVQGMQEIPLSEDLALQAKKFLQKTSFFSGWTDSELDEIMMHCQMNEFEDGSTIFTRKDCTSVLKFVHLTVHHNFIQFAVSPARKERSFL